MKILRLFKTVCLLAGILAIAGCAKAPGCSDEKTVGLIKRIVSKSISDSIARDKEAVMRLHGQTNPGVVSQAFDGLTEKITGSIQMTVDAIRKAEYDSGTDKHTCDAQLSVALPPNYKAVANTMRGINPDALRMLLVGVALGLNWEENLNETANLDPDNLRLDIRYTSQLTEGKGEQLVELKGHAPLVKLVTTLGSIAKVSEPSPQPKPSPGTASPASAVPTGQPGDLTRIPAADIVSMEPFGSKFKALLGDKFELFGNNLSASGLIQDAGEYYFGTGCMPGKCNISEAVFAIGKRDQSVYAAIMEKGEFFLAGAEAQAMPEPLKKWLESSGGLQQ